MTIKIMAPVRASEVSPPGALDNLRTLIQALPVPTAPFVFPQHESALGLALMDLSLRLDHVPRLSEQLTLVDRGHMSRSVSVDVDLDAVSARLRKPLTVSDGSDTDHGGSLWVPVSRYSRRDLAPIVVRDSSGHVVPRFTHSDTDRVTAAAFVRLLSMLINAHKDITHPDTPIHKLRHTHQRSRWLIERAITELVTVGSPAGGDLHTPLDYALLPDRPHADANPRRAIDSGAIRDLALEALDALFREDDSSRLRVPFAHLLQLAARQYMLIVLLDVDQPRRFLTWNAPLLPAQHPPGALHTIVKNVLPVNREFVVEYETEIPRSVKAYHLTVEVNQEISVRRFLMSSDVDDDFVNVLAQDLETLAARTTALGTHHKLLELELQGVASRLAELGRRRLINLANYDAYLDTHRRTGTGNQRQARPSRLTADEVVEALCTGDCSVQVLAAFCTHYAADGLRHLARTDLAGPALANIAAGLRALQLGHDVTPDNDPREHGAHAHWRRPTVDLSPQSTEPVRVVAYVALADEAPALIESITRMVAGLALAVLGIGTLLMGGLQWLYSGEAIRGSVPEQADAVVAVLLLVPGLLLARLDLPGTKTVLGQLHGFQRSLAVASVVVTTALAIAVSTIRTDLAITRLFQISLAVLALILLCCLGEFYARRTRRNSSVPRSARVPRWLRETKRAPRRTLQPDDFFDARGEV